MAQSTYQSIASSGFLLNSASDNVCNKPSGVVDGDLLVAAVFITDGTGTRTVSPPAGWTALRTTTVNSNQSRLETYYKTANSEGASYAFTKSGSIDACNVAIMRVDHNDLSSPIDTSNGAGTSGANTNSLSFADTVTPSLANELIFFIVYSFTNTHNNLSDISGYAVTNNNPSWTEILDVTGNPGTPNGTYNFGIAYANRSSTSATGNSSCSSNGGIGPSRYISQKIVIKNLTAYNIDVQDTLNLSDQAVVNANYHVNVQDTVQLSDDVELNSERGWNHPTKPDHTWDFRDK